MKSKELAISNFNIEIENKNLIKKNELIPEKIQLDSIKFLDNKIEKNVLEIRAKSKDYNKNNLKQGDDKNTQLEAEFESTVPDPIEFVEIPIHSFEVDVDLVNHLSNSGMMDKFSYNIYEKPNTIVKVPKNSEVNLNS